MQDFYHQPYLGSYEVIPERNYNGAHGQKQEKTLELKTLEL